MDDLGDAIRKAPFGHMTLVRSTQGWQAAFKAAGSDGYRVDIRDDPVDALLVVLGAVSTLDMNLRNRAARDDLDAEMEALL